MTTKTDGTSEKVPIVYQIRDWDLYFEGATTKRYNNKTKCSMPTKHGLGYRKLIRGKNGVALFGAWCALIQVLSRHEKPRQGYCTHTGRILDPHYTCKDLELVTDIPESVFEELFKVTQVIEWVDVVNVATGLIIPDTYHEHSYYALNSNLNLNYYIHTKGILSYSNDKKTKTKSKIKFQKPTAQEVCEYAKSINFVLSGEKFIAHYNSQGWKVGKNPMKNWKSAVVTWKHNSKKQENQNNGNKYHKE